MVQLTQRQITKWPPICYFIVLACSLPHLCIGCALVCTVLRDMTQNGKGTNPLLLMGIGTAFVLGGILAAFIAMYMFFGIERWTANDEYLAYRSTLFGMSLRRRSWKLSDIDNPQLAHITNSVGFRDLLPFSTRSSCNDWEVSVRNKATRKSERIYWGGTQKRTEEFFDFLRSAMLLTRPQNDILEI